MAALTAVSISDAPRPPAGTAAADRAEAILDRLVAAHPSGQRRPGQILMARAVASALDQGHHVVVEAGTGIGKSLAYLAAIAATGKRAVVATATIALQEQLVSSDLPLVAAHAGIPFSAAVLKGRANYVCQRRLDGIKPTGPSLFDGGDGPTDGTTRLVAWARQTETGDRSEIDFPVSDADWAKVSVGVDSCPGASKCQAGDRCFAEAARDRATDAQVVV
ncbi:MAG: ATP-dependent DNA helicase, partial [Acidimicrobiales bacterium]